MGEKSTIEWCNSTWNPTTGCDKISPGCDNCYACASAPRLKKMLRHTGSRRYQQDGCPRTSGPGFKLTIHPESLEVPYRWRTPRLVFVDSMSDLFHEDVPTEFILDVFAVMGDTPHTYQILTKRSRRLASVADMLPWRPNMWMGVSVENDHYTYRVDHLRSTAAAVKFISLEPLLAPVPSLDLTDIDWVIVGGESGPSHRKMEAAWVRDIRGMCDATDTAFFFKQWGGRTAKAGGREFDGRTHDAMPRAIESMGSG